MNVDFARHDSDRGHNVADQVKSIHTTPSNPLPVHPWSHSVRTTQQTKSSRAEPAGAPSSLDNEHEKARHARPSASFGRCSAVGSVGSVLERHDEISLVNGRNFKQPV